ncbi:sulfatase-like hydrolase/transferase [Evtepia sp.]|uniref:LTA synthase family protein n=1 Tax=Evtepia sp. TaxID=2773933 RepID=UPI002A75D360|nr:sulfatase-like hydrolase/transferase [Evtepia sp.]
MHTHSKKNMDKTQEGKAQGLSFGYCMAHARLYSRDVPGILPYLYIIPFFLAYLVLDFTLRFTYRGVGMVGVTYLPANLFTLGWALVFAGLVFFLPKAPRWFVRCVPLVTFVTIAVTHSGFMSVFSQFFSFSVLIFGGTGSFVDSSYIHIDWKVVAGATITVLLMMTSGRLLKVIPPKPVKKSVLTGVLAFLVGVGLVIFTHFHFFLKMDTVIWLNDAEDVPAATYQEFSDTTNCLKLCGLYQYTVRDLWILLFPTGSMTDSQREQVDQYVADYEAAQTDNDYSGMFQGKNLIMVQLEAIDTWMLDPAYMPNLAALKEQSICFENHYTPAYITASTFNTEFMTNTSLLPARGGIPTSVYTRDDFSYSIANLFRKAGYTANTFHNSDGDVYNRGEVHPNLGYERYVGGSELGMENPEFDRYLMNGFDQMVQGDPFYSFVITYSAHGYYGDERAVYQAHADRAKAAARHTEGNCVYAIGGAMETDDFIGALMAELEASGHLDDTVLVFYADHYNYYMMDDDLCMKLKGADNMNLIRHTDFFIWSKDTKPTQVEKVTSSLDVLPTLANLFGLDTTGAFFAGHDGLGDQGGYVFFSDGSWYDGKTYWDSASGQKGDPARTQEINQIMAMSNWVLAGNYYDR